MFSHRSACMTRTAFLAGAGFHPQFGQHVPSSVVSHSAEHSPQVLGFSTPERCDPNFSRARMFTFPPCSDQWKFCVGRPRFSTTLPWSTMTTLSFPGEV